MKPSKSSNNLCPHTREAKNSAAGREKEDKHLPSSVFGG